MGPHREVLLDNFGKLLGVRSCSLDTLKVIQY